MTPRHGSERRFMQGCRCEKCTTGQAHREYLRAKARGVAT